jgi:hypothetical protein
MVASLEIPETSFQVPVLSGTYNVPLSATFPKASLELTVPEMGYRLAVPLVGITPAMDASSVIAYAFIDQDVQIALALSGRLVENRDILQVEQVSVGVKPLEEIARAEFIASTINALFALAQEVRLAIPELNLDLTLRFDLPLIDISRLLQARQTAYRLMVIETVTGTRFKLPLHFSSKDMAAIILAYRAIRERAFDWEFDTSPLFLRANDEGLRWFMHIHQSASVTFTLNEKKEEIPILDKSVHLGRAKQTVNDAVIENFEQAKEALEKLDNSLVQVVIRSESGSARLELDEAPRLPDSPWPANIQTLVDLEKPLDDRLVSRYHALAAATLEGLTEEEKVAVTARPELDEEAFMIEDWHKETP